MFRQQLFWCILTFALVTFGVTGRESAATEYVWARSGYGALPLGHNATSFSNGYGGYYVPKNAYGNNYEARRPFTNPNGFIVPTTPQQATAPTASSHHQMQPVPMKPTFQQKMKRFWSH